MKFGSLLLVSIIPGPSEPNTLDTYLQLLVDDLLSISRSEIFDAYTGEYLTLKADITLHVLDYLVQGKVFHCNS